MKESQIIKILNENDLSDVEVLKRENEFALINFYFDFDKDVLFIDNNVSEIKTGTSLISQPITARDILSWIASKAVTPEPRNGSKTISPLFDNVLIRISHILYAFWDQ